MSELHKTTTSENKIDKNTSIYKLKQKILNQLYQLVKFTKLVKISFIRNYFASLQQAIRSNY